MQAMESQFDVCTEDLFNQTIKLEERLCKATLELAGACKRADAAVKKRIELENEVSANEEAIDNLDKQLEESKFNLSASGSKFDDISRKS